MSSSRTTISGEASAAPSPWPASPKPSAWACPCTRTPISASASPPWSILRRRRRTSTTPATRTGRGRTRKRTSSRAGTFAFDKGAVKVPTGPGLGIELDRDALERLHRQYLECGLRSRDDTGYMKQAAPFLRAAEPPLVSALEPSRKSLRIVVTDPIISRFEDQLKHDGGAHHWDHGGGLDSRSPAGRTGECRRRRLFLLESASRRPPPTRLKLVHVTGAGYDKISFPGLPPGAVVANTFHHARPIAEHVLMVTLMLSRNVLAADRAVRGGSWQTIATDPDVPFHPTLGGMTMGLVGMGSIGAEVARIAGLLGMDVRAVRKNPDARRPGRSDAELGGRQPPAPGAAGGVRRRGCHRAPGRFDTRA